MRSLSQMCLIAGLSAALIGSGCGNNDPSSDVNSLPVVVVAQGETTYTADQIVEIVAGATVTLDASKTTDVDGDTLTFAWKITNAAGDTAASGEGETISFSLETPGDYTGALTVSDGKGSVTLKVTLRVVSTNQAPVANAGADQSVQAGAVVTIDGSGSTDADGDTLSYVWTVASQPTGQTVTLADASAASTTFTAGTPGEYVLKLTVTDPEGASSSDEVKITVTDAANLAPVANAGADATVTVGDEVLLSGAQSSDPEGQTITYAWTLTAQPNGSAAVLSGADTEGPTFTPDVPGEYRVQLVVNDGELSSTPDEVVITATATPNVAPVADAGGDVAVNVNEQVTLDGSLSSDPDGDALTYAWAVMMQPVGASVAFDDATAVQPTFTPTVAGEYTLTLTVDDGRGGATTDSVSVSVNALPVADAGADQAVSAGDVVTLDASGSTDAEDDAASTALGYAWLVLSQPVGASVSLSDATAAQPTFTATAGGVYTFEVTVTDSRGATSTDTVTITANAAPVASAGADQAVSTGVTVTLDASGSTDAEDDAASVLLTYSWTLTAPTGSGAVLSDATVAQPTFTPDVAGTYTATVTVTDSDGAVSTDAVVIVASLPNNTNPTAAAGADQSVAPGATITLDGTGSSDPEDATVTYAWVITTAPTGSTATLSDAAAPQPTFVADVAGVYTITLTVTDSLGATGTDTVEILANTAPVADAQADRATVTVGAFVTLDGTGSSDAEDATVSYQWSITSAPAGSAAQLSSPTAAQPTFSPAVAGAYTVTLTVTDSLGATSTDTVSFTAEAIDISGDCLIISEVAEGTSSNKAIELYNCGNSALELAPYRVCLVSNNDTDCTRDFNPNATVAAGGTYTICHSSFQPGVIDPTLCDTFTNTVTDFNGDDRLALYADLDASGDRTAGDTTVDAFGQTGTNPGSRLWEDKTFSRCNFTPYDGVGGFTTVGNYIELPTDDFSGLKVAPTEPCPAPNATPVASAGVDQTITLPTNSVTLDATGSTDGDGDALMYLWTVTLQPTGAMTTFSDDTAAQPTVTMDTAGVYVFEVLVSDGKGGQDTDSVTITVNAPTNNAPFASAGPDQTVTFGAGVTLDGSGSGDSEDGTNLIYAWTVTSEPAGANTMLSDASAAQPMFSPAATGDYVFTLTVTDQGGLSSTDTVTITVEAIDISGDCLIISEVIEGSSSNKAVELYNCGAQAIDLTPYNLCLISNADTTCSTTLNLSGSLAAGATRSVCSSAAAAAGAPGEGKCDETSGVTNFNGDDRLLVYADLDTDGALSAADARVDAFGKTDTPNSPLYENRTYRRCDFTPYDGLGAFDITTFSEQGIDDFSDLGISPIAGCGGPANQPPVAAAGMDQSVLLGATVTLDATGSTDPEGGALTYAWAITTRPAGSVAALSDATAAQPTFVPDVVGGYTFELTVTDPNNATSTDTIFVSVNTPPTAPSCVIFSEVVEGSGTDYKAVEVFNCDPFQNVTMDQIYVCLVANGATACDAGSPKVALGAGLLPAQAVQTLCTTTANASYSGVCDVTSGVINHNGDDRFVLFFDADGDGQLTASVDTVLDAFGETSVRPASIWANTTYRRCDFTPYDGVGAFDVTQSFLSFPQNDVSDLGQAPVAGCAVNQQPTADAGADQVVLVNATVQLDASGSTDPEGAQLTYLWSFNARPAGSTATLSDDSAAQPTFVADLPGTYTLDLLVEDDGGQLGLDTVVITVTSNTQPSCLILSEYYEGTTGDKAVEVFNCAAGAAEVTSAVLCLVTNTNSACDVGSPKVRLSDMTTTLPAGGVGVLCNNNASGTFQPVCDLLTSAVNHNGNDRYVLFHDADLDGQYTAGVDTVLDAFGETGVEPPERAPGVMAWQDQTYRRCDLTPYDGAGLFDLNTYTVAGADDGSDLGTAPVAGCGGQGGNLPPTVDAGADQSVSVGATVQLDASGTTDPEGDTLVYLWGITNAPTGSNAALSDPTIVNPTFVPDLPGTYIIDLLVEDEGNNVEFGSVTITVAAAGGDCLIISEYVEGSSLNKAVEIYNCGGGDITLSQYGLCAVQNDGSDCDQFALLSAGAPAATLGAGQTLVFCHASAAQGILDVCNIQNSSLINHNGDDRYLLIKDVNGDGSFTDADDAIVDAFGVRATRATFAANTTEDRCDFTPQDGTAHNAALFTSAASDTFTGLGVAPTQGCP